MHGAILLTLASSWYLVGLGLTVGMVVYPAFGVVGDQEWPRFHAQHSWRISWTVGVGWLAQAVGLVWWLFQGGASTGWWWASGVSAALAVVLTALFGVPIHNKISSERTSSDLNQLRYIHLSRTIFWLITALSTSVAIR